MTDRTRRVAENEQRFRVFNEGVREVGETLGGKPSFACECGDADCVLTIDLTQEEYRHARSDARWFAVLPEHNRPDVERVVERHDAYLIVRKIGEGAELVS